MVEKMLNKNLCYSYHRLFIPHHTQSQACLIGARSPFFLSHRALFLSCTRLVIEIFVHAFVYFMSVFTVRLYTPWGFPGGSAGKEYGFDPWVGKVPWRRERPPTPVFWPGEFHGLYSPWGRKELDTTERLSLDVMSYDSCFLLSTLLQLEWSSLLSSLGLEMALFDP